MKKLIGSSLAIVALAFTSNATTNLFEPFAYSDGTLTSVSAGAWFAHSGAGSGAVQVSGGEIIRRGAGNDGTPILCRIIELHSAGGDRRGCADRGQFGNRISIVDR